VSDQLASLTRAEAAASEFGWLADGDVRVRRRSDGFWALARAFVDTALLAVATLTTGAAGLQSMDPGWRILATVTTLAALAAAGTYTPRMRLDLPREITRVLAATALALMGVGTAALVFTNHTGSGDAFLVHWSAVATLILAGRFGIHHAQRAARTHANSLGATLIVGAGHVGHTIAKRLLDDRSLGLQPIGFLDKDPLPEAESRSLNGLPDLPILGASWDLDEVLDTHAVEHVVVAFSTAPTEVTLNVVRRCWQRGVNVMLVPRLFEVEGRRMEVEHLGAMPLVSVRSSDPRGRQYAVKYAIDRILGALTMVLLAPLLVLVSLTVLVAMGRPILFRQRRVGLDGKVFEMLKFRTMSGDPSTTGQWNEAWANAMAGGEAGFVAPLPPGDRRTPLGALLRATSLDELPQLWNVVRGDMSLVGPRPEQLAYVELFEQSIARYPERHRVKSGLTGWAQINGLRGNTSLADRVEWDNFYVENWSPWLDLKILLRTIPALITRRGR
jgi:exopolysaccharide biosynthesis polyprenyl glycosylphosphotransferase